MVNTFVAMPGILKNHDLGSFVESLLSQLSEDDGIIRDSAFSTHDYFSNHKGLYSIDQGMRKMPGFLKDLYWKAAMGLCFNKLKKCDEILGLVPLPASVDKNSITLGVANELAYSSLFNIPLSIADFSLQDLQLNELYKPKSFREVFERYELSIPEEWIRKSKYVRKASRE